MNNIIKAEFLKYKRNKIWIILFLATIFSAGIIFSKCIVDNWQPGWKTYYIDSHLLFNGILGFILFSLIVAKISNIEYEEKVINSMFSYSIPRIKFIIAKLIYILFIITISQMVLFVLMIISGFIIHRTLPDANQIIYFIKNDFGSILSKFFLSSFTMLITMVTKNIIAGPAITVVFSITGFLMILNEQLRDSISNYWPWAPSIDGNIFSSLILFFICLILTVRYCYKVDIK